MSTEADPPAPAGAPLPDPTDRTTSRAAGAGLHPDAASNGSHRPRPPRVLVVDDEPALRVLLGRGLARFGYEVFLAASGPEALERLEAEHDVDAVVSDIAMPVMTGTELTVEILRRHPGIPVLFVTSSPASPHLLEDPLVGLLRKPARIADVHHELKWLIDRAALHGGTGSARGPDGVDGAPDPGVDSRDGGVGDAQRSDADR